MIFNLVLYSSELEKSIPVWSEFRDRNGIVDSNIFSLGEHPKKKKTNNEKNIILLFIIQSQNYI